MTRAPKITSAQTVALPRQKGAIRDGWLAAAVAVVALLVAMLAP